LIAFPSNLYDMLKNRANSADAKTTHASKRMQVIAVVSDIGIGIEVGTKEPIAVG
jgi:hypothetical protein